jgi:hypothetical protein
MITDHAYDAGWPRDDSNGCIAWASPDDQAITCGKSLPEHLYSEYLSDNTPLAPANKFIS